MIKAKTLLYLLICLIITFSVSNQSYARLIAPEPKPNELKKESSQRIKKPSNKVTPVILNEDDLNSMMNSMENRSPFLDTKLFDFAYSVPVHLHIKNGYNKYLLRESMKNILNESVRLDRVKKGFNASIDSMINLKSKYIQDFILDSRSRIYDIINYKKMEKYFFNNNSETNKNVHSKFYFSFISCKLFIDQFS